MFGIWPVPGKIFADSMMSRQYGHSSCVGSHQNMRFIPRGSLFLYRRWGTSLLVRPVERLLFAPYSTAFTLAFHRSLCTRYVSLSHEYFCRSQTTVCSSTRWIQLSLRCIFIVLYTFHFVDCWCSALSRARFFWLLSIRFRDDSTVLCKLV